MIEGIIKTKVIEKEVERLGIKPQPEQIENYLNGVKEAFRYESEILMALNRRNGNFTEGIFDTTKRSSI